jgi:hypothetical protein
MGTLRRRGPHRVANSPFHSCPETVAAEPLKDGPLGDPVVARHEATHTLEELYEQGINGMWIVEPM